MHPHILHNDQLIANNAHTASVGQVGLLNGWGVFSTIRVIDGILFAWEKHWERMCRDAATMHVPMPESAADLALPLYRLIAANQAANATLRVAIVRNKGGVFQAPHLTRSFDVIAYTVDLQDWGTSARLGVQMQGRHAASPMAGVKITSWSQNLTFLETAKAKGFDEVVLLNERGEVSECTSANIFSVSGARVFTPPLTSGCLPGVTRRLLLEEIRVPGVTVEEKMLRLEDLYSAGSVFITSTTRELLRVDSIEDRPAGGQDEIRQRLQTAFSDWMARYASSRRQSGPLVPEYQAK